MKTMMCLLAMVAMSHAIASNREAVDSGANPIRKVVNMLQAMQRKVVSEGEKQKELYEKFACYCKNGAADLQASIAEAESKAPAVGSAITEAEQQQVQLKEDLKSHQADRAEAKAAVAEATQIREKEAAAFAAESGEYKANLAALTKAITAIDSGMAGGFLQTSAAQVLRQLSLSKIDMLDADRQDLVAFLSASQSTEYVPQSGEISGILKEIKDEMSKSLADVQATEDAAIKSFEELCAAKKKQMEALTASIEEKTVRSGELAVSIVQMKNDLSDTQRALVEDQGFLKDLDSDCAAKAAENDEAEKTRAQELVAIAETIKILNDDDALELFKKTLPSASASFVQMKSNAASVKAKAASVLRRAKDPRFDFILLAMNGKKIGFDKVLKMIDNMISTLKTEQVDDDNKKEYCGVQLDTADDKKKVLENSIASSETAIAKAEESLATIKDEISALEKSIKDLDKSVAEATANRKEEHEDFTELMASDSAAKELLLYAKNRLNKFYNPKLYKAPPKKVLSREDQIYSGFGGEVEGAMFAQVSMHSHNVKEAPPPPPETAEAYKKKSEESNGVIAMLDMLVQDLEKEMTESETTEENDQKAYESMMKDAADNRASSTSDLTDKQSAKASTEEALQTHGDQKASTENELMATSQIISNLHSECDWLLKFFDTRKEARSSEIDALNNAKAVLNGADYSLLQTA